MLSALVAIVAVVGIVLTGIPVGFALLIVGFFGLWYTLGLQVATSSMVIIPYTSVAQESLTVLPLFILTGSLVFESGLASNAFDVAHKWLGRLPGGLGITTIATAAAFAATTGSSAATSATVGKIAVPEMRRYGYSASMATGISAAGGILGIMIPPSISLVVYGIATNTSIGKLLIAGIIPGLVTAIIFSMGIAAVAMLRPTAVPRGSKERYAWRDKWMSLARMWGMILIFVVVIGGIFAGVFTPSEAAAAGCMLATVLLVMKHGRHSTPKLLSGLRDAAGTTCMVFFIIIGANVFSSFAALSGMADVLVKAILSSGWSAYGILALIVLMYIPLGMFLEPMSMALITLPLVFPIITGLGFDPIWFGVMITAVWEVALLTPPVGFNCYVIAGLFPDIPLQAVFKGAMMFIALELVAVVVLVIFPQLATWLPGLMGRPV